jgi:hypothetical protein
MTVHFHICLSTITEPVQNFPNNLYIYFHLTLIKHNIFLKTFDNNFSIIILCTSIATKHSLFKRIHFSHPLCTQFIIQHMPQCPSHLPALIQGTSHGLGSLRKLTHSAMLRDTEVSCALQWGRPFKFHTIFYHIRAGKATNSEKCKIQ